MLAAGTVATTSIVVPVPAPVPVLFVATRAAAVVPIRTPAIAAVVVPAARATAGVRRRVGSRTPTGALVADRIPHPVVQLVDAAGQVHYSDQPPPPGITPTVLGRPGSARNSGEAVPAALRDAMNNHPVVLYTTADCGPCQHARQHLSRRGIPFVEKTVGSPADVEALCAATGFSRFPVEGDDGELLGYLHIKDVLEPDEERRLRPIEDKWIRPFAPVTQEDALHDVLEQLQRRGAHMARVVDVDGVTLGLATLEDVIEELIGEIRDAAHLEEQV